MELKFCIDEIFKAVAHGLDFTHLRETRKRSPVELYLYDLPAPMISEVAHHAPLDSNSLPKGEVIREVVEVIHLGSKRICYKTGGGGGYVNGDLVASAFIMPFPTRPEILLATVSHSYEEVLDHFYSRMGGGSWIGLMNLLSGALFISVASRNKDDGVHARMGFRPARIDDAAAFLLCLADILRNSPSADADFHRLSKKITELCGLEPLDPLDLFDKYLNPFIDLGAAEIGDPLAKPANEITAVPFEESSFAKHLRALGIQF
ncbi:MAG: hypothetical protein WC956_03870 [bacterium]